MNPNEELYNNICSKVHSINYHTGELLKSCINSAKRSCIASCRRSKEAENAKIELEQHGFDVPTWIIDAISDPSQWSE